jgi:putative ribosome biogenesis GTPase RsgA
LVTGKHNTKGVEVADTTEVNLIDEPGMHEVPEVDVEKDTRKDEDVNKFEKEENASKDHEVTYLLDIALLNIDE